MLNPQFSWWKPGETHPCHIRSQLLQQGNQLPGDPKAPLRQKGHDPSPALPGTRGAADAVGVVTDAVGEIKEEHRQGPQLRSWADHTRC